jgi:hypothetical protein
MKFVTSLSVDRMHGASIPFWPHGVKRLVVVVVHPDPDGETLVAYGVDPDYRQGQGHGRVVFEAELPRARLSAFIAAVIDGNRAVVDRHLTVGVTEGRVGTGPLDYDDAGELVRPCADGAVVVISYPDPGDAGRKKIALALAAAIRSDEALAEAVARRYPPRIPGKDC